MEATMYSLRIMSKGKIEDVSQGFDLGGIPFSVFVRPKSVAGMETSVVIDCKLICDRVHGEFPVPINDWTPGALQSVSPNGIDLATYDVYWGAGETLKL